MRRTWVWIPLWLLALWLLAMSACTSMGSHNVRTRSAVDFGPPETLSFCLLTDDGISEQAARDIIDEAWREEFVLD